MSENQTPKAFNPYYEWLGIPEHQLPATYYRLLGLENFESNPTAISNGADRAMAFVRTFQTGKRSAESQQLLNELAAARVCLLNADQKATYDDALRVKLDRTDTNPLPSPPIPTPPPLPTAPPPPPSEPPMMTWPTPPKDAPAEVDTPRTQGAVLKAVISELGLPEIKKVEPPEGFDKFYAKVREADARKDSESDDSRQMQLTNEWDKIAFYARLLIYGIAILIILALLLP